MDKIRSIVANVVLVAVMLLWVVGVDYMPGLKVLGLPLFLLAFALWAHWSDSFKRLSKWMGFDE